MPNYDFTYDQEIGTGPYESKKPHWPGGKSGVTIGPGYDMGGRSKEKIKQDMMSVGIDEKKATRLAEGSKLKGDDAIKWKNENEDIRIDEKQQRELYDKVLIPEYERDVKKALKSRAATKSESERSLYEWDNLDDEQKQILFDYQYNPGLDEFPNLTDAVVHKDREKVQQEYKRFTHDKNGVKVELPRNKGFKDTFLKDPSQAASSATKAGKTSKASNASKAGSVSKAGNVPNAGSPPNSGGSASAGSPANNFVSPPAPPPLVLPEIPKPLELALPDIALPSLPGYSLAMPAARVGDYHVCPMIDPIFKPHFGGPIIGPGIPNVIIGGSIAATVGDMCTCVGPPDSIIKGSTSVLIGSKMSARFLDNCAHGGVIIKGCFTVFIGDTPGPTTIMGRIAATVGNYFIEFC